LIFDRTDELLKIDAGLDVLGFASRKRQYRNVNGSVQSRVKWGIHRPDDLIKLLCSAVFQSGGPEAVDEFKSGLPGKNPVQWFRTHASDYAIQNAAAALEVAIPSLEDAVGSEMCDRTKLLELSLLIVDERSAKQALSLWADMPPDEKLWLWRKLSTGTQDLLTQAKNPKLPEIQEHEWESI
jgi:hypothetical protein